MAKKDQLAEEQLRRYKELKATRDAQWMVTWQYISQYFLPQASDINIQKTEGSVEQWTQQIYDTTAIQAAQTLRSGQYNWLTPPNQPWAEYDVPSELKSQSDEADDATDDAVVWLGRASDTTMSELARSNFYPSASEGYLGVGIFGTDAMIEEEGRKTTINFVRCKIGTYVFEEDDTGICDTLRREFELTYRQAKQKFNLKDDVLPDDMERANKDKGNADKKYKFLHCIFPREDSDRLPGARDGKNKPFASVYISLEYNSVVRVAGYDENPILLQRFDKFGESIWGFSPAYLMLPNARQLNYVQQYMDALAELHAYPRILTPDNLDGDVDLAAGGNTVFNSQEPDAIPREWASVGDYKLGMELQEQKRQAIRDAFFVQAFKLLNSEPLLDKDMTAFEIGQRQAEQLSDFTPAFGRRITEFLNPLMTRTFAILYRAGKFGQAPQSLMRDLGNGHRGLAIPEVVITSRISDALKALKNRGTDETMRFLLPIVETSQSTAILDNFDMDKMAREYAKNTGMPPDLFRKTADIKKTRATRAQQQQQQQMLANAEQASGVAANLGKAPPALQQQLGKAA